MMYSSESTQGYKVQVDYTVQRRVPVDSGQGPAYWQEPWPQVQVSSYVLTSLSVYQWLGLLPRMNWLVFPGGNASI